MHTNRHSAMTEYYNDTCLLTDKRTCVSSHNLINVIRSLACVTLLEFTVIRNVSGDNWWTLSCCQDGPLYNKQSSTNIYKYAHAHTHTHTHMLVASAWLQGDTKKYHPRLLIAYTSYTRRVPSSNYKLWKIIIVIIIICNMSMLPTTERPVARNNINVRINNWQNSIIASRQQKIIMF